MGSGETFKFDVSLSNAAKILSQKETKESRTQPLQTPPPPHPLTMETGLVYKMPKYKDNKGFKAIRLKKFYKEGKLLM